MRESVRNMLKQAMGMTDEDIERISPGMEKMISTRQPYQIVAEVTDAKYCFAGCKVGDRLVVGPGPVISTEKSTCPLCIGVVSPLMERVHIMWDRIIAGGDPNETWLQHMDCFDPGLEGGGLGHVAFKVYAEKVE